MTEYLLIRHAAVALQGQMIGRSDLAATLPMHRPNAQVRARLNGVDRLVASPALRCRQTAEWLLPDTAPTLVPSLWEQDFGAWEGKSYADIPDLGPLSRRDLAAHRPPQGESFLDLCARIESTLPRLEQKGAVAVIAHAGVIRAFLGLALGAPEQGLAFAIDPLSLTVVRKLGSAWAIGAVNLPLDTPEDLS